MDGEIFEHAQAYQRRILSMRDFLKGQSLNYVLTLRFSKGKKITKLNLYTKDEEHLVLSASHNPQEDKYIITTNSRESEENSLYFIGYNQKINQNTYLGFIRLNDEASLILPITKILVEKNTNSISCAIAKQGGPSYFKDGNSPPQLQETTFEVNKIQSQINSIRLVLSYEGEDSLVFTQEHDDEFSVRVAYPLSLFNAISFILAFIDHIYS